MTFSLTRRPDISIGFINPIDQKKSQPNKSILGNEVQFTSLFEVDTISLFWTVNHETAHKEKIKLFN